MLEGSTGVFYAKCPLGGHGVYWSGEETPTPGPSPCTGTLTLDLDHCFQGAHGVGVRLLPHAFLCERVQLPSEDRRGSAGGSCTQGSTHSIDTADSHPPPGPSSHLIAQQS